QELSATTNPKTKTQIPMFMKRRFIEPPPKRFSVGASEERTSLLYHVFLKARKKYTDTAAPGTPLGTPHFSAVCLLGTPGNATLQCGMGCVFS
ncbi:MAG TPA: hypothetical protein PLN20_07930, partial [Thermotogota bacterium]|nr:hypothetical protein [Thermotogota bacterium]